MGEKLYNTYNFGDDLTLFEIDRKTIKNKDYLLLLQKQNILNIFLQCLVMMEQYIIQS